MLPDGILASGMFERLYQKVVSCKYLTLTRLVIVAMASLMLIACHVYFRNYIRFNTPSSKPDLAARLSRLNIHLLPLPFRCTSESPESP